MKISLPIALLGLAILFCLITLGCNKKTAQARVDTTGNTIVQMDSIATDTPAFAIVINRDVKMKQYFAYLDSLVQVYDTMVPYKLTEHLLVRANPWIIDTLYSYDYDLRMPKGQFIADQKEVVMLRKGDTLYVPNDSAAADLLSLFANTIIDVNIPEFQLRIFENGIVKHIFPVRVGRDEKKYLKLAGHDVSLRTPIGEGEIVRIEKNPLFMNPVDGKRYYATHRDDGKLTQLPQIPFLEPSVNGQRPGSMIHPTTNPHTLGKAYSNGCIGTGEGAAWVVYYHAPLGTKIRFRYDLNVVNEGGDTLHLKNVYKLKNPNGTLATYPVDTASLLCRMDTLSDGTVVHVCSME
jgi:hypothetical protein